METLLTKFFPEGKRKLMVTLIALALAFVAEQVLKRPLDDNLVQLILGVVGVFTLGNAAEHAAIAKVKSAEAKVAAQVSDVRQAAEQGPDYGAAIQTMAAQFDQVVNDVNLRIQALTDSQAAQAQNLQTILQAVNRRTGA